MKNVSKRFVCVALALILLMSVSAAAFAEEVQQPFSYYTALGDSIPYHIDIRMQESWNSLGFRNYTYPAMIAEHYGVSDGYYGTRCGWRATEALAALIPDYYGDDYTENFLPYWGGMNVDQIKAMGPQYRDAVIKADLITLNFGSNDLLGTSTYVTRKVMIDRTAGTPMERATLEAIENAMQSEDLSEVLAKLLDFMKSSLTDYIQYSTFAKDLTEAVMRFPATWDTLICEIRKLNPTAIIAAVNIYNPSDSEEIGNILTQELINVLNNHMKNARLLDDNYIFVETGTPNLNGSRDGSHLGNDGHREMADKIIAAIDSKLPCRHEHCTLVNAKQATALLCGYSGDLRCDDCGAVLEYGHIVTCSGKSIPTVIGAVDTTYGVSNIRVNFKNSIIDSIEKLMNPIRMAIFK